MMGRGTSIGRASRVAFVVVLMLLLDRSPPSEASEGPIGTPPAARNPNPLVAHPDSVVPRDYNTIQDAIDAGWKDTVILVRPGEYRESLTLKDNVTLLGEFRDTVTVVSDATAGPVLTISGCSVGEVSYITFRHAGSGALSSPEGDDVSLRRDPQEAEEQDDEAAPERDPVVLIANSAASLRDCVVRGGAGSGLIVRDCSEVVVERCVLSDNAEHGIRYEGDGVEAEFRSNTCGNNGGHGIHVCGMAGGMVEGNVCRGNARTGIVVAHKHAEVRVPY